LLSYNHMKSFMGQGFSVGIDDSSNQRLYKMDTKPWVLSKRNDCKSLEAYCCKVDVYCEGNEGYCV